MAANWDNLPTLCLVKIHSYLPPQDRLSAGLVSQNWKLANNDPSLWKKWTHTFGSDQRLDEKAVKVSRLHGVHIRSLTFNFNGRSDFRRAILRCSTSLHWITRRKMCDVREFRMDVMPRAWKFAQKFR